MELLATTISGLTKGGKNLQALLVLEDGFTLKGKTFSGKGEVFGEVVFNTSMTGYQEMITDPSYRGQILTLTFPLVGNYGVNDKDVESTGPSVAGFIAKECCRRPRNRRASESLGAYLDRYKILGVEGIDTRSLTLHLRRAGTMHGVISTQENDPDLLLRKVLDHKKSTTRNLVEEVSSKEVYTWFNQQKNPFDPARPTPGTKPFYHVIVYDFGVKYSILRQLASRGCRVTVVPHQTTAAEVMALQPDGILLSNGPGDPVDQSFIVPEIEILLGKVPLFGICLGHQLLALACGFSTFKLTFGHRGGNHPVKELATGKVQITSQNHGYCVQLEVMRDHNDNVVVICSIENIDPMGVHTGESITVAPAQTLSDKEYQLMRDASIRILREIGVETGGCNIQYALNPVTGKMIVVEMNPRVSRSSALASKATGFPIAKIAAKLAVGYTLDELANDITRETPASFEPALDYCVVKIPRWDFAKFPEVDQVLTTHMKSVGEVMSIGRTFKEALQKALRSLEQNYNSLHDGPLPPGATDNTSYLKEILPLPLPERIFSIAAALRECFDAEEISRLTGIDCWFIDQLEELVQLEKEISALTVLDQSILWRAKTWGFSDSSIAHLTGYQETEVRRLRSCWSIEPTYRRVDTCAGEFKAYTPYFYSTYEEGAMELPEQEQPLTVEQSKKTVIILGSGPNRIGQGLEFDYCCVQAALALREQGFRVVMVNCNPETVSTDYDISDCLYFEPLTLEDVLSICHKEKPDGIILQFGGQTPLKLSKELFEQGLPIWGTSPLDIGRAENRRHFAEVVDKLDLWEPPNGIANCPEEAIIVSEMIGFPLLVRPSYVLGGLAMRIVYSTAELEKYLCSGLEISRDKPLLLDKFLEDALEVDVDALSDGELVVVAGIMEHVEQAGIHSGDSCCVLPPYSIGIQQLSEIRRQTTLLARELKIKGLINIQFAVRGREVFVLEANPRGSRTIPFVGKATGIPLAGLAARVVAGASLRELGFTEEITPPYYSVKEAVFSFNRFDQMDIVLGPEMRSTGEVMGLDSQLGMAMAKAQLAAGTPLPVQGKILITVAERDKPYAVQLARALSKLGFHLLATPGTSVALKKAGIHVEVVNKIGKGLPNLIDYINEGCIDLIINTPAGSGAQSDGAHIRRYAVKHGVSIITTMQGAMAALEGIRALRDQRVEVCSLQQYYK